MDLVLFRQDLTRKPALDFIEEVLGIFTIAIIAVKQDGIGIRHIVSIKCRLCVGSGGSVGSCGNIGLGCG